MTRKDIDFIARHYHKGGFNPEKGWKRISGNIIIAPVSFWRRYRVAAAVAATIVISATAAIVYHINKPIEMPQQTVTMPTASPLAEVKVIDFENASLPEVIAKIEAIYGVSVENLPNSGEDYKLSLHYEGTAIDLISTINDILGTHMTVVEL